MQRRLVRVAVTGLRRRRRGRHVRVRVDRVRRRGGRLHPEHRGGRPVPAWATRAGARRPPPGTARTGWTSKSPRSGSSGRPRASISPSTVGRAGTGSAWPRPRTAWTAGRARTASMETTSTARPSCTATTSVMEGVLTYGGDRGALVEGTTGFSGPSDGEGVTYLLGSDPAYGGDDPASSGGTTQLTTKARLLRARRRSGSAASTVSARLPAFGRPGVRGRAPTGSA